MTQASGGGVSRIRCPTTHAVEVVFSVLPHTAIFPQSSAAICVLLQRIQQVVFDQNAINLLPSLLSSSRIVGCAGDRSVRPSDVVKRARGCAG